MHRVYVIVNVFILIKDWVCFQDSRTLHLPLIQEKDMPTSCKKRTATGLELYCVERLASNIKLITFSIVPHKYKGIISVCI